MCHGNLGMCPAVAVLFFLEKFPDTIPLKMSVNPWICPSCCPFITEKCPDTIPLYKWTDYYLKKPYFMNEILLDRMQYWHQQKQQLCLSIIITLQGNCCYNSVLSSLWSTHRKSITNKEAKIIELKKYLRKNISRPWFKYIKTKY